MILVACTYSKDHSAAVVFEHGMLYFFQQKNIMKRYDDLV